MSEGKGRNQPVTMTREELYTQVWRTPMSRLAAQYGITGNGLAKICDRHNIPYPPRGYWAKEAAGKPLITYRLPEVEESRLRDITIRPTPPQSRSPVLPPGTQAKVDRVRADPAIITVPRRLTRPHPIIAGWLVEHERCKEKARRETNPWMRNIYDPGEFSQLDRRKHRILHAVFKALERQGAKILEEKRQTLFAELQGEKIEFQIREKSKRVRGPLSPDEMRRRLPVGERRQQELQPTGRLLFAIKTFLPSGLKREWLERDDKPLETLLPDIVATFVAAAPLLAERTRQRAEEARQYRIVQQKRYEEEQRRKRDNNRWRRMVEFAHQWREAEIVRGFIAALKEAGMEPDREIEGRSLGEWLLWAEQRLQTTDPINRRPEEIFAEIAQARTWSY